MRKNSNCFDICGEFNNNAEFEIMQYTGLKDKNGKEIYEGDILRTNEHIDFIVWNEKKCGFSYSNDKSNMSLPQWFEHGQYSGTEIIGNIYENPELLKGE